MEGFSCTHNGILMDVPYQIWEAITTDGTSRTPLWLTRSLHNKPVFYSLNYARCYFHYLSPHFLSESLSPLATIAIIIGLYLLWRKGGKPWKLTKWILILYPLIFLFELQRRL